MSMLDEIHLTRKRSARYPDLHNCPRGAESGRSGEAVWDEGERCSYCGSLHPDVFMERLENRSVLLGATDKDYKVYVQAKDGTDLFKVSFRDNNCPGGDDPSKWVWTLRDERDVKFYFQHLSEPQMKRFIELLNERAIEFQGGVGFGFYRMPFFIRR